MSAPHNMAEMAAIGLMLLYPQQAGEALGLLGVQLGWTALLGLAAWAMLRAGTRSLEVQGG